MPEAHSRAAPEVRSVRLATFFSETRSLLATTHIQPGKLHIANRRSQCLLRGGGVPVEVQPPAAGHGLRGRIVHYDQRTSHSSTSSLVNYAAVLARLNPDNM